MIEFKTREEYLDWLNEFTEYGCKCQPEEKPVDYCLECEKPLYKGDSVFNFNDNEYYCEDCIEECRTIMKENK